MQSLIAHFERELGSIAVAVGIDLQVERPVWCNIAAVVGTEQAVPGSIERSAAAEDEELDAEADDGSGLAVADAERYVAFQLDCQRCSGSVVE